MTEQTGGTSMRALAACRVPPACRRRADSRDVRRRDHPDVTGNLPSGVRQVTINNGAGSQVSPVSTEGKRRGCRGHLPAAPDTDAWAVALAGSLTKGERDERPQNLDAGRPGLYKAITLRPDARMENAHTYRSALSKLSRRTQDLSDASSDSATIWK